MIIVHSNRIKDGESYPFTQECDVPRALELLVSCELRFGGICTDISTDGDVASITVETRLMSCLDTSVFSGPAALMRPLLTIAIAHSEVRAARAGAVAAGAVAEAHVVLGSQLGSQEGIPLYLDLGAPIFLGQSAVKLALLVAGGITESDIELATAIPLHDVLAALQLTLTGECTFPEALALAS
ncbi:MAG: hypothetical protein RLZZ324_88 [Candidatus Parcubacteria bacterium]|jgi:hypothetical protein